MGKINLKILDNFQGLEMLKPATKGSAGVDLVAAIEDFIIIKPMERILVPTGIALEMQMGIEAQIRPRSGLAYKYGITVLNSPGTIDSDYRGEIKVLLINLGQEDFKISKGDRIAQMIFAEYLIPDIGVVEVLGKSSRGVGGFGSTGK